MRKEADRTYMNLMIIRKLAMTKGRVSVADIYNEIEPKMGISKRSIQRYMAHLESWGLVRGDREMPQGFSLTLQPRQLISEMSTGVEA